MYFRFPPPIFDCGIRFPVQTILSTLGTSRSFSSVSLVVSGPVSAQGCVDIGTGLYYPPDFYVKAPFPRLVSSDSNAVGPVSVSLLSTCAVDLISSFGSLGDFIDPSDAIRGVANGLRVPSGGGLST